MAGISFQPIGYVESPYKNLAEIPRQSIYAPDRTAVIKVLEPYKEGLKGLEQNEHIIILFHFHRSEGYSLSARPHGSQEEKGVFATRSPHRPNPIGLTISRLLRVEGTNLIIQGVDMLDGTPVLDIKPYSPGLMPSGEDGYGAHNQEKFGSSENR